MHHWIKILMNKFLLWSYLISNVRDVRSRCTLEPLNILIKIIDSSWLIIGCFHKITQNSRLFDVYTLYLGYSSERVLENFSRTSLRFPFWKMPNCPFKKSYYKKLKYTYYYIYQQWLKNQVNHPNLHISQLDCSISYLLTLATSNQCHIVQLPINSILHANYAHKYMLSMMDKLQRQYRYNKLWHLSQLNIFLKLMGLLC